MNGASAEPPDDGPHADVPLDDPDPRLTFFAMQTSEADVRADNESRVERIEPQRDARVERTVVSRTVYTRKQAAALLRVSERTLVRWGKEGKAPRPFKYTTDRLRRNFYDRTEVDEIVKRVRRKWSGSLLRRSIDPPEALFNLASYEAAAPGPVAASILQMWKDNVPLDEIRAKTAAALEHVTRLDRLQRQFEVESIRVPGRQN